MRRTSLYRTTTLAILCFSLLLTLTDRMAVVPADYVPEPFRSQADYMPGLSALAGKGLPAMLPPVLPGRTFEKTLEHLGKIAGAVKSAHGCYFGDAAAGILKKQGSALGGPVF